MANRKRPDPDRVMGALKDFQRDTADYVFRRLYTDEQPTRRFLLADEVGLGKTLVAKGVIAKAIDHLWSIPRIDIIYICSNADIARQNISRLRIAWDHQVALASRMTMLPAELQKLKAQKLNFVSFTPATSFDLQSSMGMMQERALLYHILRTGLGKTGSGLVNLFQGTAGAASWRRTLDDVDTSKIDERLSRDFLRGLKRDKLLQRELLELCDEFHYRRKRRANIPGVLKNRQNALIGQIRRLLAKVCVNALEPDLVILDEFQRFKHLLDGQDEASELANHLFDYKKARVVLLSATPYKMYTMNHELGQEDHYKDFIRTVRFLLDDDDRLSQFEELVAEYQKLIYRFGNGSGDRLLYIKGEIERVLRSVMVRTERLAVTPDRDGMISEMKEAEPGCGLASRDLEEFAFVDRLASELRGPDQVEYWKSGPYHINLADGYKLKNDFKREAARSPALGRLVQDNKHLLLPWDTINRYEQFDSANPKLRALIRRSIDCGAWRLLWVPPSLPYSQPSGAFAESRVCDYSKSLIFSGWRVVPKTIASLCSYEAERRMVLTEPRNIKYEELRQRQAPVLRFGQDASGMSAFTLLHPCVKLATQIDPLQIACRLASKSIPPSRDRLLSEAARRVKEMLKEMTGRRVSGASGYEERWSWAALCLLDTDNAAVRSWIGSKDPDTSWRTMIEARKDDADSAFVEHVDQLAREFEAPQEMRSLRADLISVLAKVALASPAVVALRSLCRLWPGAETMPEALAAAAKIAIGFRSMYNLSESIIAIRGVDRTTPYWEQALDYGIDGNIQAMMDEYVHVLRESLAIADAAPGEAVKTLSDYISEGVSLRTTRLEFDEIDAGSEEASLSLRRRRIRCRFALAFGQGDNDEGGGVTREDQVRHAFNSPFRPFVLASTSVGQEGLDFHQFCHRVYHWNLPSNPVDLEQREGRVHRYKGHVIRKNLAAKYGLASLGKLAKLSDPWQKLFSIAAAKRKAGENELVPYWICETDGGCKIERYVPILPLSRDEARLRDLKSSLAVYRLAIGQSRQEELVEFLKERCGPDDIEKLDELKIDLSPPKPPRQGS